jgi:DNA-binding LytR/AlgR family response regulator
MYNIAICDDERIFIDYMKRMLNISADSEGQPFRFYEFHSGEELISSVNDGLNIDLLILDMELGGMDGDETAQHFRERQKEAVLVFCSGVRAPSVISFRATPYRYLLKSYSDDQMIKELKEILAEMAKRAKILYITGHYRSNTIRVNINDIMYFETAKRGSRIVVRKDCEEADIDTPILIDEKLDTLEGKYPQIVRAHSSYMINISHVKRITGCEVFMDDGSIMTISRTYQKSFRLAVTKEFAGKY